MSEDQLSEHALERPQSLREAHPSTRSEDGLEMSAPSKIRKVDLNRMADLAKEKGVRVELEIDGKIIRIMPDNPVQPGKVVVPERGIRL
jgi:hypothetical protein